MQSRPEVIQALRRSHQLTLRALASRAGIDPATLLRIERGESNGRPASLMAIARALDVPVSTIADERAA